VLRGVTAVLQLDAFRNQTLAAFLAAAADNVAARFSGHACPEAELVFPCALGWLIGAFAHGWCLKIKVRVRPVFRLGGRTLGFGSNLSTRQWQENALFSAIVLFPLLHDTSGSRFY
jgi:hypothetical protein